MPLDSSTFRDFFSLHATGVAVVTLFGASGFPRGLTISSLSSLSADPPMASFNLNSESATYKELSVGTSVGIHLLDGFGKDLARQFSSPIADKFSGLSVELSGSFPRIEDSRAIVEATVHSIHSVSQSAVVVLSLNEVHLVDRDAKPLIYFNRDFL